MWGRFLSLSLSTLPIFYPSGRRRDVLSSADAAVISLCSAGPASHDVSLAALSGCRFGVCGVYDIIIRVYQRFDSLLSSLFLFFLSFFVFSACLPSLIPFLREGGGELPDCVGLDQWDDIIYLDYLSFRGTTNLRGDRFLSIILCRYSLILLLSHA